MATVHKNNVYCQTQAIIFNSFNQIITNTLTGDIMVLFLADVLLFKTTDITFILSLIPLISIIRLPLIFLMRGIDYIKAIKYSVIVKICFVIALLLIPLNHMSFYKYSILILIYQIAVEFGVGICWQPLMREITTTRDRGSFFGKMRFCFMMLNSLYVFLISVFIGESLTERQYKILLLVCLVGLLIQYYAIRKLAIGKNFSLQNCTVNKSIKRLLYENRAIVRVLLLDLIFLCAGVTLNVVYLKNALMYSSKVVSLYITIFNLSSTFLLPFIGQMLDKNYKKGISYICFVYVFYLIVLLCLPANNNKSFVIIFPTILYAILSGIISSGVYLIMTILQHGCITHSGDSFVVLNIYQMIIYISTFFVTNIMGYVITWTKNTQFSICFLNFDLFKLINMIAIVCCVVFSKSIKEKIILSKF